MNSKFLSMLIASLFAITSMSAAYAQPLDDITTTIIESENSGISVKLTWNHDDAISNYEIGCVSCIPNFSEQTTHDEMTLHNITALPNGDALLYIIAYDNDDNITAKQIVVKLP